MAARTVTEKIAVNLLLNNGTTTSGQVKTIPISIGKINTNTFDADKALTVAGLIEDCLTKSVYDLQKVEISSITN